MPLTSIWTRRAKSWGNDPHPHPLPFRASAVLVQSLFVRLTLAQCKRMIIGFCMAGLFPTFATFVAHFKGTDLLTRFLIQADEVGQRGHCPQAVIPCG